MSLENIIFEKLLKQREENSQAENTARLSEDDMSTHPKVKVFEYIPGKNDAEYIKKLEELKRNDEEIIFKAISKIKSLSKKGRWIPQSPSVDTLECSNCGYNIISKEMVTPYCPWCGAKMENCDV